MEDGVLADLCAKGSLIPILFAVLSLGGALELVRLMRAAGLRPQAGWAVCWACLRRGWQLPRRAVVRSPNSSSFSSRHGTGPERASSTTSPT